MVHPQVEAHAASLRDPDIFWLPFASKLITWIKKPTKALHVNPYSSSVQKWSWFPDGSLNTCYNCVDRHPSSRVAIQYVSPVTKTKETIRYGQLRERVEAVSGMLKHELNINKGDTVIIYSITYSKNPFDYFSAHDSGGCVCDAGMCENWSNSFGCIWRFCACRISETNRRFESKSRPNNELWN